MALHKSQVFALLLLAMLGGIAAGSSIGPHLARIFLYSGGCLAAVSATIFWGSRKMWLAAGILAVALLGLWRAQGAQVIADGDISRECGKKKVVWEGMVAAEPDIRDTYVNLMVRAERIIVVDGQPSVASGRVLVRAGRYPEYRYGDRLEVSGKLEVPKDFEDFSYKQYLAKSGIYCLASYPSLKLIASSKGNLIIRKLLQFKDFFVVRLSQILPEPQNSLLLGLLVGARRSLPADLLNLMKLAGVTHIIAISGFNISIITRILGGWLQKNFGPKVSLALSALVVVGFVIITGAQASVVRAAIMGIIVALGLNLGRISRMLNALLLAAAAMAVISPSLLLFDAGFQLSFLSTLGLVSLSEPLERLFLKVPNAFELRSILAATMSAQIFVLPLLLYDFGQVSLVAPLANILILPIIPMTMLFGFISGLLAMIFVPVSYLTAWLAWALLTYQVKIVEFFGRLPFAAISPDRLPLSLVLCYYSGLLLMVWILTVRRRQRQICEFINSITQN